MIRFYSIAGNVVLTAIAALSLSCSVSPRYNQDTQVIPRQKTKQVIEKTPFVISEPISEKSEKNTVISNSRERITGTESAIRTGNDTIYTFYQQGIATYYADKFHGRKTAFGERYNKKLYTAAHRTLPHNSLVRVTALSNKKSVIVRINDRGPFIKNRVIDLSNAAAEEIDLLTRGITKVTIETIDIK